MRLIQFVATGSAEQAGHRLQIIAFLLRVSECKTQAALAKKLKLTPGRISQKLKVIRYQIAQLYEAENARG